jgi:molybdopterin-guanine dinucleotide biosynthesis protein A
MSGREPLAVSGIVLAGGRSRRFGSDKLAARVGAGTLLDRSVSALAQIATDIVLVVAPGDERVPAPTTIPLRIVADAEAHGGPLIGLLTGLEAVDQPLVVVVGGDMPALRPDVLRLLARTLNSEPTIGAVVLRSRGTLVPLPAAVRTGAATDWARRLVGDGERRLRSLFERLPTRILEEEEWRPLDPDGDTLRDVDRPGDLPGAKAERPPG